MRGGREQAPGQRANGAKAKGRQNGKARPAGRRLGGWDVKELRERLYAYLETKRRLTWPFFAALGRWYLLAAGMGLLCGGVGAAFSHAISAATALRAAAPWLVFLLPLAGLAIGGTNLILEGARAEGQPPLRLAALIFAGTVLTHLCGGSSGREGAALQMGGCMGSWLARRMHLTTENRVMLLLCGMSGLFSALFGTPVAAAVFSIEVSRK